LISIRPTSASDRADGHRQRTIRAYENTLAYLATALERRARIMTGNLNLWPSIGVLIANPATLAALPGARTGRRGIAVGAAARRGGGRLGRHS
jgi:hypothetical protein